MLISYKRYPSLDRKVSHSRLQILLDAASFQTMYTTEFLLGIDNDMRRMTVILDARFTLGELVYEIGAEDALHPERSINDVPSLIKSSSFFSGDWRRGYLSVSEEAVGC